jgi:hypothetical protein
MRTSTRLAALTVGLLSLLTIAAASAGAVTWHNSADTAFTATAGTSSLSVTGTVVGCTSSTVAGTAPAVTTTTVLTVTATVPYVCIFAATSTPIECAFKFTGTLQHGSAVTGSTEVTCGMWQFGTKLCHIAGARPSTYFNPTGSTPATTGRLTLATSNLIISNGPVGICPFGNNDVLTWTEQTYLVNSGTGGPVITRTA